MSRLNAGGDRMITVLNCVPDEELRVLFGDCITAQWSVGCLTGGVESCSRLLVAGVGSDPGRLLQAGEVIRLPGTIVV